MLDPDALSPSTRTPAVHRGGESDLLYVHWPKGVGKSAGKACYHRIVHTTMVNLAHSVTPLA